MARSGLQYGNRSLAVLGLLMLSVQQYYPGVLAALREGQTAAWLLVFFSGILSAVLVWPVALALRRIPRGSLSDLAKRAVGAWGARLYAVLLAATFAMQAAVVLRETSEMALTANYPHTPQTFAVVSLLLPALLVAWADNSTIVRSAHLTLIPVLVGLALVLVGTLGWGTIGFLAPFWGPGPLRLALATPAVAVFYAPVAVLYIMADGVTDRQKLPLVLLSVPLIAGLVHAVGKANLLMVFAYPLGINVTFPLHEAARLVIGGRFFERIEGFWLFIWVVATVAFLSTLIHAGALIVCRTFGIRRFQTALPPLAAAVLTLAYFPADQAQTVGLNELASLPVFFICLGLPVLFAALAAVRGRLS